MAISGKIIVQTDGESTEDLVVLIGGRGPAVDVLGRVEPGARTELSFVIDSTNEIRLSCEAAQ
jgi:hypothetical protein